MRKVLALTLAAAMVAGTLVGCGGNAAAPAADAATATEVTEANDAVPAAEEANVTEASGDFDWKKFDGEEITVLFSEHTYADAVEEKLGDFTEKTGIKVNYSSMPEGNYLKN